MDVHLSKKFLMKLNGVGAALGDGDLGWDAHISLYHRLTK